MKILLTTTSFQDTPGAHHTCLEASGFEVVRARGPLNEAQMLALLALLAQDASTQELNNILRQETKLSYSLLRLVNSAAIAPRTPVGHDATGDRCCRARVRELR
mgnify:CR=1 FL=1